MSIVKRKILVCESSMFGSRWTGGGEGRNGTFKGDSRSHFLTCSFFSVRNISLQALVSEINC